MTYINILCLEHSLYFLGAYQVNKSPATRTHLFIENECKTDAVTVWLFRISTIEHIIINPVNVAKHLVVLTVLEDLLLVIIAKTTAYPNQILQRATMLEY